MFGHNPIRPPEKGDGQALSVQEIFPTLQGEGPYTGVPSVFIRLGGCNLACSFCDTEFESFETRRVDDILSTVEALASDGRRLAVITGGEPLRQPIAPLCEALIKNGYTVQLETNGTLWRGLPDEVEIVCSPKVTNGSYHPLRPDLLSRISALKFLISDTLAGYGDVPDVGQAGYDIPVYVQPMDEYDMVKNQKNLARTMQLSRQGGYLLSLQTHKLLGIA